MNNNWYQKTWVICLFFVPTITPLGLITLPIGLILLLMRVKSEKKLSEKYGSIDQLDNKINSLTSKYEIKNRDLESSYNSKKDKLDKAYSNKSENLDKLYKEKKNSLNT